MMKNLQLDFLDAPYFDDKFRSLIANLIAHPIQLEITDSVDFFGGLLDMEIMVGEIMSTVMAMQRAQWSSVDEELLATAGVHSQFQAITGMCKKIIASLQSPCCSVEQQVFLLKEFVCPDVKKTLTGIATLLDEVYARSDDTRHCSSENRELIHSSLRPLVSTLAVLMSVLLKWQEKSGTVPNKPSLAMMRRQAFEHSDDPVRD